MYYENIEFSSTNSEIQPNLTESNRIRTNDKKVKIQLRVHSPSIQIRFGFVLICLFILIFELVRILFVSVRFVSIRFDSVQFDSIQFVSFRFGLIRFGSIQYHSTGSTIIRYFHSKFIYYK